MAEILNIEKRVVYDKLSAIKWLEENEQKYIITHIDGITAHRPTIEPSGFYGKIEKFNMCPVTISLEERMLKGWDVGIHRDSLAVREFLEQLIPSGVKFHCYVDPGNEFIIPSTIQTPQIRNKKVDITFLF